VCYYIKSVIFLVLSTNYQETRQTMLNIHQSEYSVYTKQILDALLV